MDQQNEPKAQGCTIDIAFSESALASYAIVEGKAIGECECEEREGKWRILHTGVREEFGGRGIARLLVEKIIEEARRRNIKIVPICSYARKMMLGDDSYADVL